MNGAPLLEEFETYRVTVYIKKEAWEDNTSDKDQHCVVALGQHLFLKPKEYYQIQSNKADMDIRLVVLSLLLVAVSGRPHKRLCPMSRYSSVASSDITALKQLQHDHERNASTNATRCYRRMLRHKPSVCDLTPRDRIILTLERVSLAVDVLANMSTSPLRDAVTRSLMVFLRLKDDLMICRGSADQSEPTSPELKLWLAHLQHFKEVASTDCVQDAVILSLISLRVEDVTCWALNQ
ncbi:uncharacterized protein [Hyperolius riggenbachi]|uniref:uncharacterized protein n=1 Tax=Hyperolius riggenbachi TaxID=752182 RepID=UPI0035A35C0E